MDNKFRKRNTGRRASNLTDEEVIAYIDERFEGLKSNRKSNTHGLRNSKFVHSIIDKFSKIFNLWDENRFFQSSIDRTIFEKIYGNMHNVFHTNPNNNGNNDEVLFSLSCQMCGGSFPLKNQNCLYSFECHKISDVHKEYLKSLSNDRETVVNTVVTTNPDLQLDTTCSSMVKIHEYEQLFVYARCYLCSEHIIKFDPKKNMDDGAVGSSMFVHLKTISHRNNYKLFQKNQQHLEEIYAEKLAFRCKLCKINLFLDELVLHFTSFGHMTAIADFIIDNYLEKMLID